VSETENANEYNPTILDRITSVITMTRTAEQKLTSALSPSTAGLARGNNYEKKKNNIKLATRTIVEE
jgi:hypothetical protein